MITINEVKFETPKEFISFCNKLKIVNIKAYNKFLAEEEEGEETTKVIKKEKIKTKYIRYNGYTPIFWFQEEQEKAIPVYNIGFRADINSKFLAEIKVPYKKTKIKTEVDLYYNFVKKERYAVIKEKEEVAMRK